MGVGVLFAWKRRQERAVSEFSRQISQLTREDRDAAGRIGVEGKPDGARAAERGRQ